MTYFYGNIYNSFKLSGTEIWIRALQVGRQPEASPGLELGLLSVPLLSENLSLITARVNNHRVKKGNQPEKIDRNKSSFL